MQLTPVMTAANPIAHNEYRPDIDGLRAIAVLAVALYHFGIGPFSGGFVGVDIFFVISGYLITSIVSTEIKSGRFSFCNFYKRRVLRLLPPYAVVAFSSLIVGYFILLPTEYFFLSKQILYSSIGLANFLFLSRSGGYFDSSTDLMPMLHMWSLSVEEQFYILWPIILIISISIGRKSAKSAIVLLLSISALSLAASVITVQTSQPVAFYMLHTRAWELAMGGLISFAPPIANRAVSEVGRLAGLALIAFAVLYTDPSKFPGWGALAPAAGASLIIWPVATSTVGGRLLACQPIVALGLISYSLYLWHWPVAVFARHATLTESFDRNTGIGLFCLSVILAAVTYRFVETPFRRRRGLGAHAVFVGAGTAIAALSVASVIVVGLSGIPGRLDPAVVSLADGTSDHSRNRRQCHRGEESTMPILESCVFGDDIAPTLAMWADSHGMELADAIGESLQGKGASLLSLTYSACPASMGFFRPDRPNCKAFNEEALRFLVQDSSIHRVFITAFYSHFEQYGADNFYAGLRDAVGGLSASGKRVTILGPAPTPGYRVPSRAAKVRLIANQPLRMPADDYRRLNERALREIASLTELPNVDFVSVGANFCNENYCNLTDGQRSYYFDDHHLSMHGARIVARSLVLP